MSKEIDLADDQGQEDPELAAIATQLHETAQYAIRPAFKEEMRAELLTQAGDDAMREYQHEFTDIILVELEQVEDLARAYNDPEMVRSAQEALRIFTEEEKGATAQ